MPVIVVPIKISRENILGLHFSNNCACDLFCWKEPTNKGATISSRIWYSAETDFRYLCQDILQCFMIFLLDLQEFFQLPDLCQSYSGMEFGNPIIVAKIGMLVCSAIRAYMIVTMVRIFIAFAINRFIIGHHHTSFTTSDGLYKIKRKRSGVANGSNILSFI